MDEDENTGESDHPKKRSGEENDRISGSVIGGAILGASLGGPVGAIFGSIVGAVLAGQVNDSKRNKGDDENG